MGKSFIYKFGLPNFMTVKEDYLRAIYHIQEETNDANKKGVSSIGLCRYLNLSKSTVSEMLRKLVKDRCIIQKRYGKIILTKKGIRESKNLTKKHRVIEVFLNKVLKINPNTVHNEAHKLEHAFSDDSIKSIIGIIKHTKKCPHGKPIP